LPPVTRTVWFTTPHHRFTHTAPAICLTHAAHRTTPPPRAARAALPSRSFTTRTCATTMPAFRFCLDLCRCRLPRDHLCLPRCIHALPAPPSLRYLPAFVLIRSSRSWLLLSPPYFTSPFRACQHFAAALPLHSSCRLLDYATFHGCLAHTHLYRTPAPFPLHTCTARVRTGACRTRIAVLPAGLRRLYCRAAFCILPIPARMPGCNAHRARIRAFTVPHFRSTHAADSPFALHYRRCRGPAGCAPYAFFATAVACCLLGTRRAVRARPATALPLCLLHSGSPPCRTRFTATAYCYGYRLPGYAGYARAVTRLRFCRAPHTLPSCSSSSSCIHGSGCDCGLAAYTRCLRAPAPHARTRTRFFALPLPAFCPHLRAVTCRICLPVADFWTHLVAAAYTLHATATFLPFMPTAHIHVRAAPGPLYTFRTSVLDTATRTLPATPSPACTRFTGSHDATPSLHLHLHLPHYHTHAHVTPTLRAPCHTHRLQFPGHHWLFTPYTLQFLYVPPGSTRGRLYRTHFTFHGWTIYRTIGWSAGSPLPHTALIARLHTHYTPHTLLWHAPATRVARHLPRRTPHGCLPHRCHTTAFTRDVARTCTRHGYLVTCGCARTCCAMDGHALHRTRTRTHIRTRLLDCCHACILPAAHTHIPCPAAWFW